VRQTILARRYAKALFALGKEQDKIESYSETLTGIADLYAGAPEIEDALTNPLYPLEAKQKVMAKIAEAAKSDATMTSFLNLLVEKKRADVLPDIASELRIMVDHEQNISHGSVVSAVELDTALLEKIQATLEKITGNKVTLETEVDPTIIGGIVAKVGDLVLDGSIKTQLTGLKEAIKGRE
jgi:F-type H+-transporting ATPase subunit delta